MDNGVAAGRGSASTLGQLALGLTLLAFGLGHTGVIDGVSAADAVSLAVWVGGVTLFVAGLLELRAGNAPAGTAFAGLGAFWFTWGRGAGADASAEATGLFLVLFALLALTLTLGAASSGRLAQGVHGLLCVSLLLLAIAQFAGNDGLAQVGGWAAALAGAGAWFAATAPLASWPAVRPGRAADRGVTVSG
ncbi:acetate uptake transporter [Streptomyces sp. NPDC048639]|uniref:acetate uptake transporter n=1 Tax=Streptomyces sp. NPDC048639 TaxID=3365581 RepID=UPI00371C9CF2